MIRTIRALAVVLALGPVAAQSQTPAALPPGVFAAERDVALASAGAYTLDEQHTAVIVRVSHIGYSQSVFRFDRARGSLTWDPAAIETSKLSASVEAASITTNVKGFAEELAGENFLKSKTFPEATFVSTSFKPVDRTRGRVEGQFTLMGKTRPVTFDVELGGAGKGFGGKPRIGVHAVATISPQDYGLPALFTDPIQIQIDTEFERNQ
ncbi:YceI family protein [Reyranella aquatilis]|uniref:YceI family protein n=1 Tax=Reyranella aquatilis TaxID=2035356 RepID=A0ABS8L151_9HYPH|nr:YceI family protein [Reyranella aquatilis]MCC8432045.1 YceI family protein [Reyranella aquatilis]